MEWRGKHVYLTRRHLRNPIHIERRRRKQQKLGGKKERKKGKKLNVKNLRIAGMLARSNRRACARRIIGRLPIEKSHSPVDRVCWCPVDASHVLPIHPTFSAFFSKSFDRQVASLTRKYEIFLLFFFSFLFFCQFLFLKFRNVEEMDVQHSSKRNLKNETRTTIPKRKTNNLGVPPCFSFLYFDYTEMMF